MSEINSAEELAVMALRFIHTENFTTHNCPECQKPYPCPTRMVLDEIPDWRSELEASYCHGFLESLPTCPNCPHEHTAVWTGGKLTAIGPCWCGCGADLEERCLKNPAGAHEMDDDLLDGVCVHCGAEFC